jgi:hypothetical protein
MLEKYNPLRSKDPASWKEGNEWKRLVERKKKLKMVNYSH